jgi:XTP/dITP diphosphohydrolase
VWPGVLATEESGEHGFGYDPIFVPDGHDVTAAELDPAVKNAESHRARAFEKIVPAIRALSNRS